MKKHDLVTKATYSAEDNKLRIYVVEGERFNQEDYNVLKKAGFTWAPVQKLFVAPSWSPRREDVAVLFGGELQPEEITVLERASAKAERLEVLAEKRHHEAGLYARAAASMSDSIAGQPVLQGHHSERRARRAADKVQRLEDNAAKNLALSNYWLMKAESVERHANGTNCDRTRRNRINKLLADLRDRQRDLNGGALALALWDKVSAMPADKKASATHYYAGSSMAWGPASRYELHRALISGDLSVDEAIAQARAWAKARATCAITQRWVHHTLCRLGYETAMLGEVSMYDGELTPTVLKGFARAHGAHKPECEVVASGYRLFSSIPLPMHIATGNTVTLTGDEWRGLMQEVGYEVPAKRTELAPIVNVKADTIEVKMHGSPKALAVKAMSKATYNAVYKEFRGVKHTTCGQYRVRVCLDPDSSGEFYTRPWVVAVLTDSKQHALPESASFTVAEKEAV